MQDYDGKPYERPFYFCWTFYIPNSQARAVSKHEISTDPLVLVFSRRLSKSGDATTKSVAEENLAGGGPYMFGKPPVSVHDNYFPWKILRTILQPALSKAVGKMFSFSIRRAMSNCRIVLAVKLASHWILFMIPSHLALFENV